MMKAILSTAPGGPETLEIAEIEVPAPGPGQVMIRVKAAGVNFPDTLIIKDLYQFRPPRPFSPGAEVAGIIESVGENVSGWAEGDRVAAFVGPFGGYRSHVVVPTGSLTRLEDGMDFTSAAGFLMTYGTSYHALIDRARLQQGESLVVLGASGGVGSAAVEIGKAVGARVVAAVSSKEKAAFAKELGADETVIYPRHIDRDGQKALSGALKTACGGDGADVVYDAVGGDYAEPALRALGWEGRFLVVGFPAGIPSIPLNLTLLKGCQIMGVFFGGEMMKRPRKIAENFVNIQKMIADGMLTPRVTETFPLEKAADALRKIEAREAVGKLVLTVD